MRRRAFITLFGCGVTWPLASRAQQPAMPVIGFLNGGLPEGYSGFVTAYGRGLAELGYVERQNIIRDRR